MKTLISKLFSVTSIFLLLALLPSAIVAQKDSSGVYMNAENFRKGEMEYAINCKNEKHRINPHDFFVNKECIKVVHRDSVYMLGKDTIWGVKLCDGSVYRVFKRIFYPVLNPKEYILLYRIIPAQSAKNFPKAVDYYFSKSASAPVEKLTYENLRNAFSDNPVFQNLIHEFYTSGGELTERDDSKGCYKINLLHSRSLQIMKNENSEKKN